MKLSKIGEFHKSTLSEGVNLLETLGIIVYQNSRGDLTACRNICRHQGGKFSKNPDKNCILTCSFHGWRLDASTFEYVNPSGGLQQERLTLKVSPEGKVEVFRKALDLPWSNDPFVPTALKKGEFTVRFLSHACAEIQMDSKRLITDPWLTGPAFTRGWWLQHLPPTDWLTRLASCDAIYISHNHSDHLNLPTLNELIAVNPSIPIYIPQFESNSCVKPLETMGFKEIHITPFFKWISFGPNGRFMILPDAGGRDDSGLLVDYKGHLILNTVDCTNLNNGEVPSNIDLLMASFAGGASGYPVCWEELYPEEKIEQIAKRNSRLMVPLVSGYIQKAKPKAFMPFAGYFSEEHPSDSAIKKRNSKNTAHEMARLIREEFPEVRGWTPDPGEQLDLSDFSIEVADLQTTAPKTPEQYHFEKYVSEIRESLSFKPLQNLEGILKYFEWTGFKGQICLHIIETDESFKETQREYFIDLRGPTVSLLRPEGALHYERIRVRSDVFRHVLKNGISWEEFSIGFQARFFREPDVYQYDFWNHFQYKLPKDPIPWQQ